MGIGWQTINGILDKVKTGIKDLIFANVDLEASFKTIQIVAERTGRNYYDVMQIINGSMDAFTNRASLMEGTMKMLSTSLTTKEIQQFVNAVKEGSAAMGADFNEQLPIVAKGFKQLTSNILDNIGVTVYLDDVKRRAAVTNKTTIANLTEEQIHRELLNVILEQTAKYTGAYAAQLDTAKGSMAKMGAEWSLLAQSISDTKSIKSAGDMISNLTKSVREYIELKSVIETKPEVGALYEPSKYDLSGRALKYINEEYSGVEILRKSYALLNKERLLFDSMPSSRKIFGLEENKKVMPTDEEQLAYAKNQDSLISIGVEYKRLLSETTVGTNEYSEAMKNYSAWVLKATEENNKFNPSLQISTQEYENLVSAQYELIKPKDAIIKKSTELSDIVAKESDVINGLRTKTESAIEPMVILGKTLENFAKGTGSSFDTLAEGTTISYEEFVKENSAISSSIEFHGTLTDAISYLNIAQSENYDNLIRSRTAIDNLNSSIESQTDILTMQKEALSSVNDEYNKIMKQNFAGETQGKRNMFGFSKEKSQLELQMLPYDSSAKQYESVTKDLESAEKELESAKAQLLKRVEPRIYQEYIKSAQQAQEQVDALKEEQAKAAEKLKEIGGIDAYKKLQQDVEDLNYKLEEQRLIGETTYDAMRTEFSLTLQEHNDMTNGVIEDVKATSERVFELMFWQDQWKQQISATESTLDSLRKQLNDSKDDYKAYEQRVNDIANALARLNDERAKANIPASSNGGTTNVKNSSNNPAFDFLKSGNTTSTINYGGIVIDATDRPLSEVFREIDTAFNLSSRSSVYRSS